VVAQGSASPLLFELNAHLNVLASSHIEAAFNWRPFHFEAASSSGECLVTVSARREWEDKNTSFIRNTEALHLRRPARYPNNDIWFVESFTVANSDRLKVDEPEPDIPLVRWRVRFVGGQNCAATEEPDK